MQAKPLRSRVLSTLPRVMHVFWRFSRALTIGVRAVVIDRDGKLFLVKHSYADGWYLPGGGVEVGETLREALARELAEEGNIELLAPPVLHAVYFHPAYSVRDHIALFVVRDFRQTSKPTPNNEIVDHGFFPPDALPSDTTAGSRARIGEVLNGTPPPARW